MLTKRLFATLIPALLFASGAGHCQPMAGFVSGPAGAAPYAGPGDVLVTSPKFACMLRGYSALAAHNLAKAISVTRASDSTSQDIGILSSGNLDTASAASFAGTDATGTGAITGTTLTFTGGHVGDTVSGGATQAGTYIKSGASPTWTVNISQTVVSATLTLTWGLTVNECYDQTGNGVNWIQATVANQPALLLSGCSSSTKPCMLFNGSASYLLTASQGTFVQPQFISVVGSRIAAFTSLAVWFRAGTGSKLASAASANNFSVTGTSTVILPMTDSAWHSVQTLYSGTSSAVNIDGTENSESLGLSSMSGVFALGTNPSGLGNFFSGEISEIVGWGTAGSAAYRSAICHNQFNYWGTSVSC